jgi:hypothetical protein
MGVVEELKSIFTHYCLRGNPLEPSRLSQSQLIKLCRDCGMLATAARVHAAPSHSASLQPANTPEGMWPVDFTALSQTDIHMTFAKEIAARGRPQYGRYFVVNVLGGGDSARL